jgi:hypothetical protein
MNRESTTTLIVLSILGGFLAFALTAATNTGMVGVYVFGVAATLSIVIFMGWSDVRARFSGRRSSRSTPSRSAGRAEHPRRPARSS